MNLHVLFFVVEKEPALVFQVVFVVFRCGSLVTNDLLIRVAPQPESKRILTFCKCFALVDFLRVCIHPTAMVDGCSRFCFLRCPRICAVDV
jgi:hypothetical protein